MKTEDWVTIGVLGLVIWAVMNKAFGQSSPAPKPPQTAAQPPVNYLPGIAPDFGIQDPAAGWD